MERRGTMLDADDLSDMHVSDLRNQFGRFLKVQAQFNEAEAGTPQVLPASGLQRIVDTQRQQDRALPAPPEGARFESTMSLFTPLGQDSSHGCDGRLQARGGR